MLDEKDKKPRIAFIVSQFPRYVDVYFLRELQWLRKRGFDINIFSLRRFAGKVVHDEAAEFVPLTSYPPLSFKLLGASWYFIRTMPRTYARAIMDIAKGAYRSPAMLLKCLVVFPGAVYFARLLRTKGIDHIHANWATHPTTAAMVISRLTGIPFSFSGHASDIFLDTTMLSKKLETAKFVITCTRYNKEYLKQFCNGRNPSTIYPIYHGLDLDKFACEGPVTNRTFQILSVGSLRKCKGFPYLIAACALLRDREVDFECTIIGGGPEKRRLKRLITERHLDDKIRLLDYVSHEELIKFYQKADVVTLPALSESHFGIPNILIEALAAKTPVVATPLPAVPELVEHGATGLLVPEKDSHALADALEALVRQPDVRMQLAAHGYTRVSKDFNIETSGRKLENVFVL